VACLITEFTRFYRIEVGCQKSVRAKPASYWLKIFRHVISRFTKKGKSKQAFNSKISQKSHQIIHSADSTILSKTLAKHEMPVIFCISCHSTRSHEDFIRDEPKKPLLKMCQRCHCCVDFALICFAAADFFVESCTPA